MAGTSWRWLGIQRQVLNAILSMADLQDLLLAQKVDDLRRKVFELAAIMGRPDPDA